MRTASRACCLRVAEDLDHALRSAVGSRAFSVFELLIAISIVVLLTAIVIPISIGAIARAAAQEAQPRLEAAVAEARLEAARLASPVRLCASADGSIVRLESLRTRAAPSGSDQADPDTGGGMQDGLWASEFTGEWVFLDEVHLPVGIVLARAAEGDATDADAALGLLTMSEPGSGLADSQEPAQSWTIATALPDGRLEQAGDRLIVRSAGRGGESARQWEVRFAAWTGAVTLSPVVEDADRAGPEEEDPGLPPPFDTGPAPTDGESSRRGASTGDAP